ncbi:formimidoylglutamase [Moheibacter sediminis]|uniref:Formimidoylglutamase n=1 Tax=Moheibacter sediminis TaxID=1434700 RepID=A0A1W2BI10_9FLAO|nr:formimidoylglutamase [Moheibacter sediminis]SMC72544.1 formiminoglutamase [Moheibacter sediminis]
MIEFANQNIWTGRFDDEDGESGLRWHQVIQTQTFDNLRSVQEPHIALLGFRSDEGVRRNKGRVGAKNAPDFIRKACTNLPYSKEKQIPISDFGNVVCEETDLESARKQQIESVSELLQKKYFPIILGGGHETALGNYLALADNFEDIGIVNIDAHYDLRIPVEGSTSGTPFFEMAHFCQENNREFHYFCVGIQPTGNTEALFHRANELNVETVLADEIHSDLKQTLHQLEKFLEKHSVIYLSLDLDVLDGAFAPGVSAPCANGLTPFQVKSIIQKIIQSNKIKLFDVVELNPEFDQDNRTAKLAAHFLQEFTKA